MPDTAVVDRSLAEEIASYPQDPVGFFRDVLNVEPDRWQQTFLEAIAEHQRVAVRSSTGQGKDFVGAGGVLWFLSQFEKAYCPCTANSKEQVELVLWKQFSELLVGSNGLEQIFEWNATTIRHRDPKLAPEWLAFAKTSAKKVSQSGERHAEGSSGHHADNMLILLDEASGIEEEFWQAYEPTITGPNNKIVAIGNPNRLSGSFYQIWFNKKIFGYWKRFTISGKHHPKAAALGDEYHISDRGNQSGNHEYLLNKWGSNHPIVQSKVFGVHPTASAENTAYAFDEVMAARVQGRIVPKVEDDVQIGIDVARFGDDETVYMIRRGRKFRMVVERKQTTDHIVDKALELAEEEPDATAKDGQPLIVPDESGVGGGVVDGLRRKGYKRVRAVTFGGAARHPKAYRNLAAEMWLEDAKDYFKCTGCGRYYETHFDDTSDGKQLQCLRYEPNIEIPDDDELMHQLIFRTYGFTGKGDGQPKTKLMQRFIQPKDEMKRLGLGSPDRADALCLAVVRPKVPWVR